MRLAILVPSSLLLIALGIAAPAALASPLPHSALSLPSVLTAAIRPRPQDAPTGSELLARVARLGVAERERILVEQFLQGNVPAFLRKLQPIELHAECGGRPRRATIWVMPDYLAVGSDEDFVRVPLGLDQALRVAGQLGFTLPTRRMVDRIYSLSPRKLAPQPMPPGPAMASIDYLARHERTIAAQLRGTPRGVLTSGQKKDLVLTPRLDRIGGRVAIYGWHRTDGTPIQPLSTVHGAAYVDYSHGIRLVAATALVDGQPRSIFDVLEDSTLAPLLSDEGVDRYARKAVARHVAPTVASTSGPRAVLLP